MDPENPSLLQRLSNNPAGMPPSENPTEGLGWQIVDIQAGEVIDLVIHNLDNGEHPVSSTQI
jgi:hypothetical protein